MEEFDNNNLFDESNSNEEYAFKYNFVTTPWDDRSTKSKICIIALLLSIFGATMACVINNFVMHYSRAKNKSNGNSAINCQMVKFGDYRFAARIHSVASQEVLCLGALISDNTVLASGACVQSGPTRLRLGTLTDPRCKKGFSVDIVDPIHHDGVLGKRLVFLTSYESMAECANYIGIGQNLQINSQAYVVGRAAHRRLSRQPVTVSGKDCICSGMFAKNMNNKKNIICVKSLARCPVLAGDLLVQNGRLFGLASTSVPSKDGDAGLACFADLKLIYRELMELGIEVPKTLSV